MSFVVAAVAGSALYVGNRANSAAKKGAAAAAEQARLQQEFENTRIAEAQAEAERVRQAEVRRQQNITAGQNDIASMFGQFDDNFYNQRSKSYLDYALPTLDKQYQDQMKALTTQLARTGNLNSSLRGDLMGELQKQYDTSKLSLSDAANNYASEARASVAKAKAGLMESNLRLADSGPSFTPEQEQQLRETQRQLGQVAMSPVAGLFSSIRQQKPISEIGGSVLSSVSKAAQKVGPGPAPVSMIRDAAAAEAQGLQVAPQFQSLGQMISDLSSGVQTSTAKRPVASGAGVSLFSGGSGGGTGRVIS
jgi:hypothetical protein